MRIPAHSVCTAIRDDIVAGVYERGSRLTEELLARRYGVSRVPVREALRTLESEGFVITRRHAGACVAEPTEQEAADLLEMRDAAGAAGRRPRRPAPHRGAPQGAARPGQAGPGAGQAGQSEDLRSLGGWFHETLAQASGSPALTSTAHPAAAQDRLDVRGGGARQPRRVLGGARRDRGRRGARRQRAGPGAHGPAHRAGHRRAPAAPSGGDAGRVRTSQHPVNTASLRH